MLGSLLRKISLRRELNSLRRNHKDDKIIISSCSNRVMEEGCMSISLLKPINSILFLLKDLFPQLPFLQSLRILNLFPTQINRETKVMNLVGDRVQMRPSCQLIVMKIPKTLNIPLLKSIFQKLQSLDEGIHRFSIGGSSLMPPISHQLMERRIP